jgi:hypothetical protein
VTPGTAIAAGYRRLLTTLLFGSWIGPMLWTLYLMWRSSDTTIMLVCLSFMLALTLLAATLGDAWFRPRPWELRGAVYERLGVRWFKRFMIGGDYVNRRARRTRPGYRAYATNATLQRLSAETRAAEKGHALWCLIALPAVAFAALAGWRLFAAAFTMVNLVANVYPLLVQRDTRARIARIAGRRSRHESRVRAADSC